MSVSQLLEIGRQGLMANREGMKTTSNNVANANNPEYSRQKTHQTTTPPIIHQGVRIGGGGVTVKETVRIHDDFIQKQIFDNSKNVGYADVRSEMMQRIESLLTASGSSVGERLTKMFNDMRELSVNPELSTNRFSVKESAKGVVTSMNQLAESMAGIQEDIDFQISREVEEVNQGAKELAHLNGLIAGLTAAGQAPNELYDQQEAILEKLTKSLGYQVERQTNGTVNLIVPGAGVLVQGTTATEFAVSRETEKSAMDPSMLKIYLREPGSGRLIPAKQFPSGTLGGLLHVREQVIKPTINHVDQVAFKLAQRMNEVHRGGQAVNGDTGLDLFVGLKDVHGAAQMIRLNTDIDRNSESLAVGFDAETPGDNRVALSLAAVQDEILMPTIEGADLGTDAHQTLGQSLNSLLTNVGTRTAQDIQAKEHQDAIMDQLHNHKQSVSGVSLEEEAINMIQYQTAFNAAAKTMQVGDELLQTIIDIV